MDETHETLTEERVERELRRIVDPEVRLNIVDLGLVYGIDIDRPTGSVHVTMTLTTPGCPLHEPMAEAVRQVVGGIPGVRDVDVDIVFDPPWTPDRITPEGRRRLGLDDAPAPGTV
jgi:metal-sulfur cluster biosynthetic enzyme